MNNYILFIKNNRKKLFILLIILNILAVIGLFRLNINTDFDIFKIDDSKHLESFNSMNSIFSNENQTILLIETDNIESDFMTVDTILKSNGVYSFMSPLDIFDLIDLENYNTKEGAIKSLDSLSPIVFKDNKIYGTYSVSIDDLDLLHKIENDFKDSNIVYYMSGDLFMASEILKLILTVLIFIPPLALFLVLIIFRSQLSSFKATILSIIPAGLSALWTLGLVGWFGGQVSLITVLAPIFSIVIGSADGLHFISHMEDEFKKDKSHTEMLNHTLSIVGVPMIITTTTSIAGFLGLLLINTEAIKDLAIFASIGVFLAGIITWYILPLILTGDIILPSKDKKEFNMYISKLWGRKSIVIIVTLLLISSVFIPHIKTEFNQLMFFRDYTTIAINNNKIIDVNDGVIPLFYFGKTTLEEKDVTINALKKLIAELEDDENVKKVISPFSLMPDMPTSDFSMTLDMLSKVKNFIRIGSDGVYYRLIIFPKDLNNETMENIHLITNKYEIGGELVGIQFLMSELNNSIVEGQIKSILFTYLLILIMLYISLKSFKLMIISSLPIVFTSIIIYGFLGLTGISLTIVTSTIFSITLGIGVDYAIHYTSVYKYFLKQNSNEPRKDALKYSSRPIIANALGLSLGLTALFLSPLQIHVHISLLMWVAMFISVFISLTLIPTLLKKI